LGCAVVDTFTILPPMPIIPGGPGASPVSCHGGNDGSITIEPTGGTPNYSYEWFANDTLIGTDSGTSSSIDSLGEGMYELIITDANGCEMGPINITVVEPSAPLDLTISGGTTSYSYQWSAETGFQDTQTALNLIPGTYTVTVSDANGCIETAGVTIDEPSAGDFGLSSLPTTCFGDDNGVVIVENPIGGVPPYMYSDDNEIFGMNDTLFGFEAGLHTIYVQDASLCVYTNEVLVEQPFEFIVDAGPDIDILFGDTIELMAQINQPPGTDVTFTWSPDEWLSCIDCDTIYAWPHEDIIYTVTASIPAVDTTETCEARDEIRINVNNDRNIFIPNVFSPDGDGTNDIFMVFGGQGVVEVLSFRVYDRWGELLFEDSNFTTNDPSHGWDGTFRGRDMNPGVYVFAAEVMFLDGARIPYSGDLTLIR